MEVLQAAFRVFGDILIEEGEFRIRGFASFKLRIRPEHYRTYRMRSFTPKHYPEAVYVKTEVSDIVYKRVNMLYNEEDPKYKEELKKQLGVVYERAVRAENMMRLWAENRKKYKEQFINNRNEASTRILRKSLRMAMPDAPEEEIERLLMKSLEYVIPAEREAETAEEKIQEARYLAAQRSYQNWVQTYASKNHEFNTGRKKETLESYPKPPETGV